MAEVDGALCDWCKQEAEGIALEQGRIFVSCGEHDHESYLRWRLKKRGPEKITRKK